MFDSPRSSQTSIQQQQQPQQQSTGFEASSSSLSSSLTSEGVFLPSVELNKKSLPQQQENQGEQQPPQQIDQQLQLLIKQHSTVYDHELSSEEVHLLWVDIARKVFYLKKNICESVEHWNHK